MARQGQQHPDSHYDVVLGFSGHTSPKKDGNETFSSSPSARKKEADLLPSLAERSSASLRTVYLCVSLLALNEHAEQEP